MKVQIAESEMHDLIIELPYMTVGVGAFSSSLGYSQEFPGREAEIIFQKWATGDGSARTSVKEKIIRLQGSLMFMQKNARNQGSWRV